jgi:hypothetical protein
VKVFISWSGERSHQLAKVMHEWLPEIMQQVDCWLSSEDISKGTRWSRELDKRLESYNQGIICVTPDNMNSPWLNFEAGALAKSFHEGKVRPVLLDLATADLVGPLSQFQTTIARSRDDMLDFVKSINRDCSPPLDDQRLVRVFKRSWPDFQHRLDELPSDSGGGSRRDVADMVRELLDLVRSLVREETAPPAVPMPRWGQVSDPEPAADV